MWAAADWASCSSVPDLAFCVGVPEKSGDFIFGQAVFASFFFVELCLLFGAKGFEVVVHGWVGVVGAVVVDVLFWFYVYAAVLCLCAEGCPLVASCPSLRLNSLMIALRSAVGSFF